MQFYIVYIREAHAIDSRAPTAFGLIEDPITELERAAVASRCVEELDLPIPAVLDKMDDAVNQAYKAWPDRIYLVGKDGKIAYAGGRGPFFFSPDELERAIEEAMEEARAAGQDR